MPTRRVDDVPVQCRHPDHEPPGLVSLRPGKYEHKCSGCGHIMHFTVTKPTWCPHDCSCYWCDGPLKLSDGEYW